MPGESSDITRILNAAAGGDAASARDLLPIVYGELRKLAEARMRHIPPGQTLQPTALVHEVYMRLVGDADPGWNGRAHFFGAAARAMRQILVDQARRKASQKHGGKLQKVTLGGVVPEVELPVDRLLGVETALKKLEQQDPDKAQLVMLRYFTGLTNQEIAEISGKSLRTIERECQYLKAWLRRELSDSGGEGGA